MGADASIYSMIRPPEKQQGPLDQYGAMLQLKNMIDTGALNDLHRQKLSGDLQDEEAFKAAFRGAPGGKPDSAALFQASPTRALQYQKTDLENKKSEAEISEKKMATLAKGMGMLKDFAPTVRDEASYKAFAETALRILGPDMVKQANMPPQYDPEWVKRFVVKGEEIFTPKPQTVNLGGKEVVIDMNPWTNPKVVGMNLPKTQTPGEVAQQNQPVWDEARGVFVQRPAQGAPGSPPAAAPGAPAAPAAAPAAPGVIRPTGLPPKPADVHTLRNEFNQLPEVKQYKDVLPIVEAARSAPLTRAGDIQLGYAVGKILDPASVVREGEIKMVGDAAPIYEKYKGEFDSIANGTGRFTPETRKQLLAMLDNAVTQREASYKQAETTYRGVAEKNGIPVDQVIIPPMKRTQDKPASEGPKMFDSMPDPAKYSGRRLQADDGTVYQSNGKSWVRQAR